MYRVGGPHKLGTQCIYKKFHSRLLTPERRIFPSICPALLSDLECHLGQRSCHWPFPARSPSADDRHTTHVFSFTCYTVASTGSSMNVSVRPLLLKEAGAFFLPEEDTFKGNCISIPVTQP